MIRSPSLPVIWPCDHSATVPTHTPVAARFGKRQVLEAAEIARKNGARVIALTNYDASPLAALADVTLCSTAQGSPLTGENAAARIAQLNIMDAIFIAVAHPPASGPKHSGDPALSLQAS